MPLPGWWEKDPARHHFQQEALTDCQLVIGCSLEDVAGLPVTDCVELIVQGCDFIVLVNFYSYFQLRCPLNARLDALYPTRMFLRGGRCAAWGVCMDTPRGVMLNGAAPHAWLAVLSAGPLRVVVWRLCKCTQGKWATLWAAAGQ